jgi:hypothetical protein
MGNKFSIRISLTTYCFTKPGSGGRRWKKLVPAFHETEKNESPCAVLIRTASVPDLFSNLPSGGFFAVFRRRRQEFCLDLA